MKVLQVSKLFPPFWGGIETVVYDTSIEIKNMGAEVDILCTSSGRESSVEVIDGMKVYRCSSIAHVSSLYISLSYIWTWIKIRNHYDVIHVHLPNPLAMLMMFFFRTSARVIVHWHSDIVKQKVLKIPFIPFQNWLLKKAKVVLATSQNYVDSSSDLKRFSSKVVVVPIGISDSAHEVDRKKLANLQTQFAGKKIVFSLGRHVYYKGFEYLITAADYLPENYVVIIGGTGELTNMLQDKIVKNGLVDKVFLVGKIPASELGSYFELCDLFCLPSIERSEAFGVVQLEAMSFGKPIVSCNIPGSGVSWVNQDGVTGYIVPPKCSQALSEAIVKTCQSEIFSRQKISAHFKKYFTRKSMAERINETYNR